MTLLQYGTSPDDTYHDVPEHVGDAVVAFLTEMEAIWCKETVVDVTILLQQTVSTRAVEIY